MTSGFTRVVILWDAFSFPFTYKEMRSEICLWERGSGITIYKTCSHNVENKNNFKISKRSQIHFGFVVIPFSSVNQGCTLLLFGILP